MSSLLRYFSLSMSVCIASWSLEGIFCKEIKAKHISKITPCLCLWYSIIFFWIRRRLVFAINLVPEAPRCCEIGGELCDVVFGVLMLLCSKYCKCISIHTIIKAFSFLSQMIVSCILKTNVHSFWVFTISKTTVVGYLIFNPIIDVNYWKSLEKHNDKLFVKRY